MFLHISGFDGSVHHPSFSVVELTLSRNAFASGVGAEDDEGAGPQPIAVTHTPARINVLVVMV